MDRIGDAEMCRNLVLEVCIHDFRKRMVELQWKDRLALENEWMELYIDMPQEIDVLWVNYCEVSESRES